jgi:hypothetical protein
MGRGKFKCDNCNSIQESKLFSGKHDKRANCPTCGVLCVNCFTISLWKGTKCTNCDEDVELEYLRLGNWSKT